MDLIDDSMFVANSARPVARQGVLEGLWFAYTGKWLSLNVDLALVSRTPS